MTTITSAAAETVSSVMPMAPSSSETCDSSMAFSCSFAAAELSSPLPPRKSVSAETTTLSPDTSVATVTPRRLPEAVVNQLE